VEPEGLPHNQMPKRTRSKLGGRPLAPRARRLARRYVAASLDGQPTCPRGGEGVERLQRSVVGSSRGNRAGSGVRVGRVVGGP
jgi:hypothetical protein